MHINRTVLPSIAGRNTFTSSLFLFLFLTTEEDYRNFIINSGTFFMHPKDVRWDETRTENLLQFQHNASSINKKRRLYRVKEI